MAEGFLRHFADDRFEVNSAGMSPKELNPHAVKAMSEVGTSIEEQESTHVSKHLGWINYGYLSTVCGHAEEICPKTLLGVSKRIHWADLDDPAAFSRSETKTMQVFREVHDRIEQHVHQFINEQTGPAGK